jgi:hypothetical protein
MLVLYQELLLILVEEVLLMLDLLHLRARALLL